MLRPSPFPTETIAPMAHLPRSLAMLSLLAAALIVGGCRVEPSRPGCEPPASGEGRPALPAPSTQTRVSPIDGMTLLYIPAGEFLFGARDPDPLALSRERPQQRIYLDAFWIDQTEVTNAMYARCVEAGACSPPQEMGTLTRRHYFDDPNCADYPVVNVTWYDARDYCAWAGRRLPTEAEWEKAARGTDGRIYPWGNEPPTGERANFCDVNCPVKIEGWQTEEDDGYAETAPVGSYPAGASPYGVLDMAGNVSEWTADWSGGYYDLVPGQRNPDAPASGYTRVVRGGAWQDHAGSMRVVTHFALRPDAAGDGFRCAADANQ